MKRSIDTRTYVAVGLMGLFLGTCIVPGIAQEPVHRFFPSANGTWLYVGGSGPGNYTRIQDAIDNASEGDTVFVYQGHYFENITINTSITLLGEDRETTIIDGSEQGTVVTILSDGVTMDTFTVQNAVDPYDGWGNGIHVKSDNNTIQNIIIGPKNSNGIYLSESHYNIIRRNRFLYNYDAIEMSLSNHNLIVENTLGYSTLYALRIWDSAQNMIQDNDFVFNRFSVTCYGNSPQDINNTWEGNYWNIPRRSPKPILVTTDFLKLSFQYDYSPSLTPHGAVEVYTNVMENMQITIIGRIGGLGNTSTWDGTGLKIGRLPYLEIFINQSLRGERIRYRGRAVNFSFSFAGVIAGGYGFATFVMEDAVGIFYHQKSPLLPGFAPRFQARCFVKKITETSYVYRYI